MAAQSIVEFSDPSEVSLFMPCELSWSFHRGFCCDNCWLFWSRDNNELKRLVQSVAVEALSQSQTIKEMIKCVLQNVGTLCDSCLVQFWAPVVIGERTFLTIADQPFRLINLHMGLCSYRKHCLDCLLPVDGDQLTIIGPPERVFRRELPKCCTGSLQFYRNEEFFLRDNVLSIGVDFYEAVPLFMPPFDRCVGVLEILSHGFFPFCPQIFSTPEKEFKLISFDDKYGFHESISLDEPKIVAFDIWLPSRDASCLKVVEHACFSYEKKGEGIVGRAFASQSACLCMDITQLSINEYPRLPTARRLGCSASFAICLQNRYASDKILVLEIFLHLNGASCEDPKINLIKLLVKVKEKWEQLTAASSGDKLFIEVIKTSALDQLESFEICNPFTSENSAAEPEHAQFLEGRRELPQIDYFSPEQIEY